MNPTIIVSLITSFIGFGLAWQLQGHRFTKMELTYANERIATARASRQTLERVTGQIEKAQANATTRGIQLRTDVSAAVNAGNGLRLTTAAVVRTATSDPTVCSDTAATLGKLFDDSSTRYGELAEKAQRHVIDIQALMERQAQ